MLTVAANEELKMTSREIAELTGKQHGHVMRDIRAYIGAVLQMERGIDVKSLDWSGREGVQVFGDTPIGGVSYAEEINQQNGQSYPIYQLDKAATLTIVSGYNVLLRKRIIDRWQELETQINQPTQIPQTYPEALRLAAELAEQNIQLGNQLAIAAPKAEFYDRYADASGTFGFRQVCKALGEKEHLVRTVLVDKGVMYRLGGQLTPYQNHIDAGRFTVKTGEADNGHAFTQARFTTKGVTYVAGLIAEHKLSAA